MELKRVVVTGLGAITPIGNDVETTWLNAVAGKSGAAPITHFDASQFKTQFACEVKDFNPNDHFDRKKLRQLDLYAQYAMVAARQAVADSGIEEAAHSLLSASSHTGNARRSLLSPSVPGGSCCNMSSCRS